MSASQSKQRDSRKAKTSILFEIKQNTEHNIQIGQSINIISLNTAAKCKPNTPDTINYKNQSNPKPHVKRSHQSGKLTIKLGSGNNLIGDQQNRITSLHNSVSYKKLGINDVIDKFQKRHLINVDKNKISSDLGSFMSICSEFLDKIDGLQLENCDLVLKVKKYENYFKELKTKEGLEALDLFLESPSAKNQKSNQLKILNLERKVETLNYIIKNYRSNNKEELKQFEKKVNEYKPTIQIQLTQMLAEANRKYEEISKQVQYFEKQCDKHYKGGNWVEIVRGLQSKDQEIKRLEIKNGLVEKQNSELRQQNLLSKGFKSQLQTMNRELIEKSSQLGDLKGQFQKLKQQKINKQVEFQELSRTQEELTYKYEALIPLQAKIKQKQQTIRKNSQAIMRLQNQNSTLKNKIGTLVKNSQAQFFDKQSGSRKTIQKCSVTIQELASRFCEQIEGLPQVSKQLTSFITHLYQKTKNSFQKIVEQYKTQLQEFYVQNKQLKNRLNTMIGLNKRKYEYLQEIVQEVQNIEAKRKRCEQSQSKIEVKDGCSSCLTWVLHWGQLNNLYNQLEGLFKRLREIE